MKIRTFDCDGVIYMNKEVGGLRPEPNDVIITGRSYEERPETEKMLAARSINNAVYYNPLKFEEKTRASSGKHKANIIGQLQLEGYEILFHIDDDAIQADVIRQYCPDVPVVLVVHDFTEKENVRHVE